MKGSLAEELYSESLKLPKLELDSASNAENKVSDFQDSEMDHSLHQDDSFWDGSDQELEKSSDLDRAWQRRREQFHTREKKRLCKKGLISAFGNQSFLDANGVWFEVLPDALKGELIDTEERRTEFKKLHESTRSLSTTDALKLFNDSIVNKNLLDRVKVPRLVLMKEISTSIEQNKSSSKVTTESFNPLFLNLLESKYSHRR